MVSTLKRRREAMSDGMFWFFTGMITGGAIGFILGMVAVCMMLEALGGG